MRIDIEATYIRYGPMVLRRCRKLLNNEAHAVEAMQDTFVRLLEHQGRLEDKGLSSLLFRIATNVCLNRLRTQRRKPETREEALLLQVAAVDETEKRTWSQRLLERIFSQVPDSTRLIAVLHLVDGMTHQEVATEVGLSVSGVRKRLRGLRTIANELVVQEGTS
ncbi:MAG: sigma-70 family RNA polymerase sigma factor [Myxococcales bacterium]|nr:sigma-70 family RNA polymerase sigma factor [Myxococcales bacterium]